MDILFVCLIMMVLCLLVAGVVMWCVHVRRDTRRMCREIFMELASEIDALKTHVMRPPDAPKADEDKNHIEDQYEAMRNYKVNAGLNVTPVQEGS